MGIVVAVDVVAIVFVVAKDPGEKVPQPHRAAAKGPRPAAGDPWWAAPARHWVGLSEDWNTDGGFDDSDDAELASDGRRVVTVHRPFTVSLSEAARVTGYDGATGKRLWNTGMPWTAQAAPVAGNGEVIIPSGDGARVDYIALDTATGKGRWRIPGRERPAGQEAPTVGRSQPAGVLRGGVFYYADGTAIAGVDAATGRPRYRFTGTRYHDVAGPVAADGRIVALATRADGSRVLLSLLPDLRTCRPVRLAGAGGTCVNRLAVSGDVAAAWSQSQVWTADAHTGRSLVSGGALPADHVVEGVLGRTVVVGGTYAYSGEAFGYDLLTGRRAWSVPEPDDSTATDGFDVQDGTLFALGNQVTILDPATGRPVFERTARGGEGQGPRNHSRPLGTGGLTAPAAGHLIVYNRAGLTGYR